MHSLNPLPAKYNVHSWQSTSPVLVGVGKTVLKYFASEDGMLSFANNKPVKIFSKGAGSNPDLWGVMVSSVDKILAYNGNFRSTGDEVM